MDNGAPVAKKRDEPTHDIEQQFILRMPPGPAMALRHDVQSGANNLKEKLAIELQSDMRHGRVIYGGQVFNAKLVDLPCIIESLKTTDNKSFYKTADICQMLLVNNDDEVSPNAKDSPQKKEKRFLWNHGVTPPLKNVRKRRFRKTLRKKYQEQPDIENELKRILRMDSEATSVRWEVVSEDDKTLSLSGKSGSGLQSLSKTAKATKQAQAKASSSNVLEAAEYEIFGELSDSDEEAGVGEEKDINVLDSNEDDSIVHSNMYQQRQRTTTAGSGVTDDLMQQLETSPNHDSNDLGELHSKLYALEQWLEEAESQRAELEDNLRIVDSKAERLRVEDALAMLAEDERSKRSEYEILRSMLSQSDGT